LKLRVFQPRHGGTEGFERGSSKEFHQFLVIAKASCAKLGSQHYVAFDIGFITRNIFDQINSIALEVFRIIGRLKVSIQKKK
jgi:four helix bundle protein